MVYCQTMDVQCFTVPRYGEMSQKCREELGTEPSREKKMMSFDCYEEHLTSISNKIFL